MATEVKIPEVGESVHEVEIGQWHKVEGDTVEKDEIIVEIETDKATLEVPAPETGELIEIIKQQGDSAEVGDVIARITAGESNGDKKIEKDKKQAKKEEEQGEKDSSSSRKEEKKRKKKEEEPADESDQESNAASPQEEGDGEQTGSAESRQGKQPPPPGGPRVMPSAQRMMREHDLSADQVRPSGPGGRVLKEDVQRHLQGDKSQADAPAERGEEVVRMSLLRRRVATALVDAQRTAALLTTFNEVDMSAVKALRAEHGEAFEKRYGVRLGFMSFFVKAAVEALKEFPRLNAEVRGDSIVFRNYYDIGIAVSSEKGLVVPVLRNAERMSFAEVESAINKLAARARDSKLDVSDLEGGTFTITNGGVFGSLLSTPIVNPPQSGILGMHAIQDRPVAVDGQVVVRPMMYLALTYDHRIVDGREAVLFLRRIADLVAQPSRILIEV